VRENKDKKKLLPEAMKKGSKKVVPERAVRPAAGVMAENMAKQAPMPITRKPKGNPFGTVSGEPY